MVRSRRRLRTYILALVASAGVIVVSCFALNCLVDPLWYLQGNRITGINYAFNERLAKLIRLLPRLNDYDCIIFGTSRATLLPEEQAEGHRCYNLAFSDGQASEYLPYARYLRQRGFAPSLLIVEIRRSELIGPELPAEIPDFVRSGQPPPSILTSYLTLDALEFSIRTLREDGPHHRFYDKGFQAELEVRSKKRWYRPPAAIEPAPPPYDFHPERAARYRELRQLFPAARAIGFVPAESAWRMAAFSATAAFDPYLAVITEIAASYDGFLDFSAPSGLTLSKAPTDTYDGMHYSRAVNGRVLADLLANRSTIALDWRGEGSTATAALLRRRLAQFVATTTLADPGAKSAKESRKREAPEPD